jgi:hypothetical protein
MASQAAQSGANEPSAGVSAGRKGADAARASQKRAARWLQNCLKPVIVSVGAGVTIRSTCSVAWSGAVPNDLQTKLEKYERKAAHYEKAAQQAAEGPQRAFYQGLALYCDELATKFREVIAKRSDASLAAE